MSDCLLCVILEGLLDFPCFTVWLHVLERRFALGHGTFPEKLLCKDFYVDAEFPLWFVFMKILGSL
mgnify:CR=1 FL=1